MALQKDCADHLRSHYFRLTGGRLGASHAHELVAAFFGYNTAAALRSEKAYALTELAEAAFLFPDLNRMDQRFLKIRGLPANLPPVDELASELCTFLTASRHFDGEVWMSRDLSDDVNGYVQSNAMLIEDALMGETALTNAYYDELYIEDYTFEPNNEALMITLNGSLNGQSDQDRAFCGDKVTFTTTMTFDRVAGRIGFSRPELETSGSVDYDY